jgi:demethylmenaquinone methyltransferase / 2-methoxy-6-polyprenyl-1,4-benzoquinol methylase
MDSFDPGGLLRDLAEGDERHGLAHERAARHRLAARVERDPGELTDALVRADVQARSSRRLGGEHRCDGLARRRKRLRSFGSSAELVFECHAPSIDSRAVAAASARTLFAPLGPTYDRYSALLSLGQDPRWRRFLVSRLDVAPQDTVLDVATGTGLVAREVVRRFRCSVVGVDQSPEMLAVAADRTRGLPISLVEGRAEALPFADGEFAALTFTYLLRYVEDPRATVGELARVVRPGGTVAMLEFAVPRGLWRPPWELWVRIGLPAAGWLISPGWREVGRFLGPSIRGFWEGNDPVELFRAAGIEDVRGRRLSLGGAVVVWGRRRIGEA